MKFIPKTILATGLVALATACSSTQISQGVKYTTKANHSAVPTGSYATPQNVKGTTLGTVNSKDMKSEFEFITVDGNILEVRSLPSPATNELNYTLSFPLQGTLDINTTKRTSEIKPTSYFVPTQWMNTNNSPIRQVTLDPSVLRADVTKLERLVKDSGNANGILNVSRLVEFGLQSKRIRNEDYLFLKTGTNGVKDYILMPAKGLDISANLPTGEMTLRNETAGLYSLKKYDAAAIEARKSTNYTQRVIPIIGQSL